MSDRNSKKVLIITYYWPPSAGSGVQRWLKLVKYLPEFGWQPFVFTPENPSFAIKDNSLLAHVPEEAEIIHFPIWEPYEIFGKLSSAFGGSSENKPTTTVSKGRQSRFQKLATWIRGNFFIPDPRKFWVKPSVKFLEEFLESNSISKIITTGPPHSIHLIGLALKKKNPKLEWTADFRDPWSEWGFLDSLNLGRWARSRHKKLEAQVLKTADRILTITPFYVRRFEALSGRKVELLTNGFDEDDFRAIKRIRNSKFVIRHVGIINEKCDPRPFMNALKDLCLQNRDFANSVDMEFIGEVHPDFLQFVKSDSVMNSISIFTGNIPHATLLETYGSSSLLLIVLHGYKDAEGYMPGKLFEYMATGLPILGVGPERGDAADLLNESKSGKMIDASKHNEIQAEVIKQFNVWKSGDSTPSEKISRYSRREIARRLSELLQVKP